MRVLTFSCTVRTDTEYIFEVEKRVPRRSDGLL